MVDHIALLSAKLAVERRNRDLVKEPIHNKEYWCSWRSLEVIKQDTYKSSWGHPRMSICGEIESK